MIDRRTFLATSTAFAALAATGRAAAQTPAGADTPAAASPRDSALDQLLSGWFQEDIRESPTFATGLGLDTGDLAALRGQLSEASLAEVARDKARIRDRHRQLQAFSAEGLTPAGQLNLDIAKFRYETAVQGTRFNYGSGGGRPAPYVVSQLGGSYYSLPDFLDSQHPVRDAADADFYLSRLEQFGRNLAQEAERIRHDAGEGVIPPDFVVDKAIGNLEQLRNRPTAETTLVASLVRRTAAANIAGDWAARATAIVEGPIHAGLDAQLAALREVRPRAVHDAGVWRLPDGEAFYAWGIKSNTTTTMTGDDIHRTGLAQVAELQAQLDVLLRAQGYTQGTVGQRMNALNREPSNVWPNTDEGRAQLIASLNRMVEELQPLLPRVFSRIPSAALEIRRVPPTIEAGAPGGYYQGASLDGSRPGAYYINLANTADWPKHSLPTLTYHEGSPGHHFQISIAREAGELPLYRRTQGFSAYNEGWALYSERVADELGVYENNPLGKIGFLQSYLFRAVRLVVDSGLHDKRWSREQAIQYMVENSARPEGSAIREIERYSVWPGQACAYKIGETVIARLRRETEARPGFDLKRFHDAVLNVGSMPLTLLERRVASIMG